MVKSFYEDKGNISAAIRDFHHTKNLRLVPISIKGVRATITRFKEAEKLGVKSGRECKPVIPVVADVFKAAAVEKSQTSNFGGSSEHVVSRKTECGSMRR